MRPCRRASSSLDGAGRVWAPTNHGIACFDGDRRSLIDVGHGLPNEWATTLLVDREGSLWVGSEGVQQLQGRLAWSSFTRREGLPSDTVWGVFRDRAGVLWAATNRGVAHARGRSLGDVARYAGSFVLRVRGKRGRRPLDRRQQWARRAQRAAVSCPRVDVFRTVTLASIDGPATINSLAFGPDGALYVATIAQGLHRARRAGDGFAFEQVALPGGAPDEQVNQLARDGHGRLWAGRHARSGGVRRQALAPFRRP